MKKIEKILDYLHYIFVLFLAGLVIAVLKFACDVQPEPLNFELPNPYLAEQTIIKKPLIKLPFQKVLPQEYIKKTPIPEKHVKQIIEIELPKDNGKAPEKVVLFVDDNGFVYKAKDTPKEIKVKQIRIKKPEIGPAIRAGFFLAPVFTEKDMHISVLATVSVFRIKHIFISGAASLVPRWFGAGIEYLPWRAELGWSGKEIRLGFGIYYKIWGEGNKIIIAMGVKL